MENSCSNFCFASSFIGLYTKFLLAPAKLDSNYDMHTDCQLSVSFCSPHHTHHPNHHVPCIPHFHAHCTHHQDLSNKNFNLKSSKLRNRTSVYNITCSGLHSSKLWSIANIAVHSPSPIHISTTRQ